MPVGAVVPEVWTEVKADYWPADVEALLAEVAWQPEASQPLGAEQGSGAPFADRLPRGGQPDLSVAEQCLADQQLQEWLV